MEPKRVLKSTSRAQWRFPVFQNRAHRFGADRKAATSPTSSPSAPMVFTSEVHPATERICVGISGQPNARRSEQLRAQDAFFFLQKKELFWPPYVTVFDLALVRRRMFGSQVRVSWVQIQR